MLLLKASSFITQTSRHPRTISRAIMSCAILCSLVVMVFLPTTKGAGELFYQQVKGKCSDLKAVSEFDDHKMASGDWYHQYVSYGREGDKCASSAAVERGTKNFIDFLIYDKVANQYELFPDDLQYHPELPGVLINSRGALALVLAADMTSYFYTIQCAEKDGRTEVMVMFETRERQITDKEEQAYARVTAKLKEKNLLPKMYKMSQKDCPPEYHLKIEKPATELQ